MDKLNDKYVFFDVDGTLSEYRYNDQSIDIMIGYMEVDVQNLDANH